MSSKHLLTETLNWLEGITTQDEVVPQLCLLLRHSNEHVKNLTRVSQDLLECEGLFCNLKKGQLLRSVPVRDQSDKLPLP